ncbi:MAG: hypothetical protein ABSH09_35410 [Bryobacteraceae bacterium]
MRFRFQPWQLAALLILVCGGAISGVYFYKTSGGNSPAALSSYLPLGEGALVYIDVDALRRSGILDLIAGKKASEELEYQSFVDETKFDYRDDLDAVAALFKNDQVFMALRGRFNWKSLMAYAAHHGGSCQNGFCEVAGSKPDRKISFYPIKPDLMALAVSRDGWAAFQIAHKSGRLPIVPPTQPVWAVLAGPALRNVSGLPAGTQSFASTLQTADRMVFTVGERDDHFELAVDVTCENSDKASTLLNQLQSTTDTLRRWLDREHKQPNPADVSGPLSAGSFRRDDRQVFGAWPVQRSFIEAMAGGSDR